MMVLSTKVVWTKRHSWRMCARALLCAAALASNEIVSDAQADFERWDATTRKPIVQPDPVKQVEGLVDPMTGSLPDAGNLPAAGDLVTLDTFPDLPAVTQIEPPPLNLEFPQMEIQYDMKLPQPPTGPSRDFQNMKPLAHGEVKKEEKDDEDEEEEEIEDTGNSAPGGNPGAGGPCGPGGCPGPGGGGRGGLGKGGLAGLGQALPMLLGAMAGQQGGGGGALGGLTEGASSTSALQEKVSSLESQIAEKEAAIAAETAAAEATATAAAEATVAAEATAAAQATAAPSATAAAQATAAAAGTAPAQGTAQPAESAGPQPTGVATAAVTAGAASGTSPLAALRDELMAAPSTITR